MLNRELQESMNLPPFINTAGGLGEPLPGRRGEDEEMRMGVRGNGGEGKRKRKERVCAGGSSSSSGREAESGRREAGAAAPPPAAC